MVGSQVADTWLGQSYEGFRQELREEECGVLRRVGPLQVPPRDSPCVFGEGGMREDGEGARRPEALVT